MILFVFLDRQSKSFSFICIAWYLWHLFRGIGVRQSLRIQFRNSAQLVNYLTKVHVSRATFCFFSKLCATELKIPTRLVKWTWPTQRRVSRQNQYTSDIANHWQLLILYIKLPLNWINWYGVPQTGNCPQSPRLSYADALSLSRSEDIFCQRPCQLWIKLLNNRRSHSIIVDLGRLLSSTDINWSAWGRNWEANNVNSAPFTN